jgi:hypothetical protein
MDSEDRVGLQEYSYELVDNITRGDYRISHDNNVRDINAVLDNNTLIDLIFLGLQEHYGEGSEADARFNEFVNYNITRLIDNQNNVRQPSPPTPEIAEPEPIEIPQEVIDKIPQEVLNVITCPIGGEIMRNPVINSVGQTYDRANIQQWISRGNKTDPNTRQQITTTLIPNFSIKSLINSYIPQLGGKRKYTKKNRKYKKSKKTIINKRTKNMKKIKKIKKMKKNKTIKKKVLKNKNYNKKTKNRRK